ncbi:Uncharacterised protein [Serratia ficaria]|nr:Uncharacterised protein [Serratia ficaria]
MNTQNVNVKTAAQEPSERYGKQTTVLRTDGFVRNLHSAHPFDVIRADVVLARMEKQAGRACGQHYEIYQSRLLGMAMDYLCALPLKDRPLLMGAAAARGYTLTLAEEEQANDAFYSLMDELSAVGMERTEDTDFDSLLVCPAEHGAGGAAKQVVEQRPVIVEERPQQMRHGESNVLLLGNPLLGGRCVSR